MGIETGGPRRAQRRFPGQVHGTEAVLATEGTGQPRGDELLLARLIVR